MLAKKNIGTGTADRSGTRSSLTDDFSAATYLLENRIDKLMNGFKKKEPEFFNSYQAARNIWDKGGSHTKDTPTTNPTAANTGLSRTATASVSKQRLQDNVMEERTRAVEMIELLPHDFLWNTMPVHELQMQRMEAETSVVRSRRKVSFPQ